jgi:amidase
VAPAGDAVPNTTPGDHGGNLDTTDVRAGATVCLPVFQPGGLLALGDLHALQGDGELCGQGIEAAGEVTVQLDLMKGWLGPWPVVRAPGHWAVLASAPSLDEAGDLALLRARDLLMSVLAISDREAVMLLSTVGDLRVSQIVNPLKTARICIPGWVLQRQ